MLWLCENNAPTTLYQCSATFFWCFLNVGIRLCMNVEKPTSDFISFWTLDQRYFSVDSQHWNNVNPTLKGWLSLLFFFFSPVLQWSEFIVSCYYYIIDLQFSFFVCIVFMAAMIFSNYKRYSISSLFKNWFVTTVTCLIRVLINFFF